MENKIEEISKESAEQEAKEKAAKSKAKNAILNYRKALLCCSLFCAIAVILFAWGRCATISLKYPIDDQIFGTLGDFIGGILGTVVALYSVYMLVRTFQDQVETNANVVKTNSHTINTNNAIIRQTALQIFESRFSSILMLYKEAVSSYKSQDTNGNQNSGRRSLESLACGFCNKQFNSSPEYSRRVIAAVSEYLHFYSEFQSEMSVHFRMLYLLVKYTAEESMLETDKVSYAKSIRGQLSNGELIFIRYNCLSPLGEKMRPLVNLFNLLKHVPVMNLLEFRDWKEKIKDENQINAINRAYIGLKKMLTKLLDVEGAGNLHIDFSSRVSICSDVNNMHDKLQCKIIISNKDKKGLSIKRPDLESAIDSIDINLLPLFIKELLIEMFIYSNFYEYNGPNQSIISHRVVKRKNNSLELDFCISRKGAAIALAHHQIRPCES